MNRRASSISAIIMGGLIGACANADVVVFDAALAFFATVGVLVAFTGLALALGARLGGSAGSPSFCNCAKSSFAPVAPSVNSLSGLTPVMLFRISTAVADGSFFSTPRRPATVAKALVSPSEPAASCWDA